jgi:hypothetical protein
MYDNPATRPGAAAGSAGAAGVRHGSSCRYQTPRLTIKLTLASKIRTSQLELATAAAITTPPRAYQIRTSQLPRLSPPASHLPNNRLATRAYQTSHLPNLAPTKPAPTKPTPTKPAPHNSHLPNHAPSKPAPRKPRAYQTRDYQTRASQTSQLPARNHQTRAYLLASTRAQLPIPCLSTRR